MLLYYNMADDDKKKEDDPKKCSKQYQAQLELTTIIITLFKNFVILGSMFLILHIKNEGGIQGAFQNLKGMVGHIQYLVILTLMLTFVSIIDRFIYNNLMLGLGLGLGVAIIYILFPDMAKKKRLSKTDYDADDEDEEEEDAPAAAAKAAAAAAAAAAAVAAAPRQPREITQRFN